MNSGTIQADKTGAFFSATARLVVLALLLSSALAIRLYRVTDPPLDFHPTRQYRSALLARAFYYEQSSSLPEWKQRLVDRWQRTHGWLEPPVMEYVASITYRLTGKERLWIPRVTSAILWLIGGVFVYLLAGRLANPDGAILSTAFYLFVPFGVSASRSFQPDPVMVTLLILAVYGIVRYFEEGAIRWFCVGLGMCALTPLLKPTGAFPIVAALVSLAFSRFGPTRAVRRRDVWLLVLTVALPTLAYYLYGPGARMANKIQVFVPGLWTTRFYWRGWLNAIWHVVGYPALIGAFAGVALFRPGSARAVAVGLWLGYILFGLAFAYHAHSHDYYHLFLVPVVALCLAPIGEAVLCFAARSPSPTWSRMAVAVVLVAGLLISMDRAPWRRQKRPETDFVSMAEEIGALVHHSDRTVYLSRGYGKPLQYHGEVAGVNWPSTGEIRAQLRRGMERPNARVRLDGIIDRLSPEFFVVTSIEDLKRQRDLQHVLYSEYPLLADQDGYKIFDMR